MEKIVVTGVKNMARFKAVKTGKRRITLMLFDQKHTLDVFDCENLWSSLCCCCHPCYIPPRFKSEYQRVQFFSFNFIPKDIFAYFVVYRDDGKSCMKYYTDPGYFFELWYYDIQKDMEKQKNELRNKKKKVSNVCSFMRIVVPSHLCKVIVRPLKVVLVPATDWHTILKGQSKEPWPVNLVSV